MSALRLYFLGTLDIRYDDQPLDKPPTAKSQSLLAYLILHRQHPQPRERLSDLFWGERPERKARSSLSTSLWHIRRCLPDQDLILSDPHVVQFDPHTDLWLDTQAFESDASRDDVASLQSAAALYRGDFLDGFYDDWIVNERYRLEGLFAETLARLMVVQEADGEYSAALSTALRLLGRDPLREDARRLAMRALCRLGQRNAALEQYRRCQEILQKELGAEPMVETSNLHQAILEGRFEVGRVAEALPVETPVIPAGRSPLDVIAPSVLAGRGQEMAFLHGCWQKVEAGHGGLALINGEVGVGKTRLVKEFADQLRWHSARVLWGRCYELERSLPYQPIAEAVRTIIPTLSSTELENLPAWAIAEVARLAPEIADHYPDLVAPVSIQPDQEQIRLLNGVARFLAELTAHGPLLIVLEDLHWATESTLQLVHYLVRHLADRPALMVGTLRPEETAQKHPLLTLQQQLKREGLCQPLHLDRLSSEAVVAMVQEMSGAGEAVLPLAHRLYRETEGNPFFLMEIVKTLFETGVVRLEEGAWQGDLAQISAETLPLPAGVSEAIQGQVRRLGEKTQEALRLAAVLGHEFDFGLLDAAWGQGREATLGALDDLLRHRLIDEGTGALDRDYAFTHHKIQEVVYANIPRRRRQHMHGLIGTAMEQLYESQLVMSELAFHFEHAQRADETLTEKAVAYLRGAGEQAASQYANAEALSYFGRALELVPEHDSAARFDILLAREKVYALEGEKNARARDLESLQTLAHHLSFERQIEATLCQARYAKETGAYPAVITAAQEAIHLAQNCQEKHAAAEAHLYWGQALVRQGENERARAQYEQALALARAGQRRRLEADCLNNAGVVAYNVGDYAEAKRYYEQALHIFAELDDKRGQGASLNNLGVVCNEQGNNAASSAFYERALRIHRETGNQRGECLVLGNLGQIAIAQGEYIQAFRYHEQSLVMAREIGHRYFEANALINLGNDYCCLGKWNDAGDVYESALHVCRQIGYRVGEAWTLIGLSMRSHCLGDDRAALAYGQQALSIARETGNRLTQGYALTHLGHAQMGLHNPTAAAAFYREAVDLRKPDQPHLAVESLAGLACASLAQGDIAQAQAYADEISSHLESGTLDGMNDPCRVCLSCYQVFKATQDPHAEELLTMAHDLLHERAARIADEELRRSFLENVAVHREIIEAWESR